MTSKSDDLFGGLSDSDSSDINDEWEHSNPAASILQDLEMSCSSDDEELSQEDSQPGESMAHEEYAYPKVVSSNSEGGYSTISSATPSASSSSYEDVQDIDMYDQNLVIPENDQDTDEISRISSLSNTDFSGRSDSQESMKMSQEDESIAPNIVGNTSCSSADLASKPSSSWTQRTQSRNQPSFNDEDQKMIENTKAEQLISNKLLMGNFSDEQLDRYIAFRRSRFTRKSVKNIISEVTGKPASDPIAVAVAGLAKLFVGEIVEEAVELRDALNEQGKPIQPQHIKSAFNKLVNEGKLWPPYGKKY